jgi:hypothetical protein
LDVPILDEAGVLALLNDSSLKSEVGEQS